MNCRQSSTESPKVHVLPYIATASRTRHNRHVCLSILTVTVVSTPSKTKIILQKQNARLMYVVYMEIAAKLSQNMPIYLYFKPFELPQSRKKVRHVYCGLGYTSKMRSYWLDVYFLRKIDGIFRPNDAEQLRSQ